MRERQFNHRGPLASSLPARSSFRHVGTRSTAIMVFVCSALFASTVWARKAFDESKLEFIDNGTIKLGVSPDLGGAITYLSKSGSDENTTNDYDYTLILGSLNDIRGYALMHGKDAMPPDWKFEKDRQHWRYHAAGGKGTDAGWPIEGFIQLDLGKPGMAAVSPPTLWQANDAPVLHIDAAFKTGSKQCSGLRHPDQRTVVHCPSLDLHTQ